MEAVRAFRRVEKRLEVVALLTVALVAKILSVTVLEAAMFVTEREPAFKLVMLVVARLVVPLAVRLPVEMEPELIAPEEREPVVTVVNVGFGETAPLYEPPIVALL